jgi:hypothetical protein
MNPQQQLLASLPDDAIVARIKPHLGRKKQIVDRRSFLAEVGWYGQPPHGIAPGLRQKMERCVINELNPASECVFDFRSARAARELESREQAQKLRRGTAVQPVALPPRYEDEAGMSTAELVAKEVAKAMADLAEQLAAAKAEGAAEERAKLKAKRDAAKARRAAEATASAESTEPTADPAADQPQPSSD